LPQFRNERGYVEFHFRVAIIEALFEPGRYLSFIAARIDLAHRGRGLRVERKHLFGAGLEQNTPEFLLTEFHVLGERHTTPYSWRSVSGGVTIAPVICCIPQHPQLRFRCM